LRLTAKTILGLDNRSIFTVSILDFSKCSMMPAGHHSDSSITTYSLTE